MDSSFPFFVGDSRPTWPPPPRAPLPPLPPGDYDKVMPFAPPSHPDLAFYRGNFCGIRVKGAPAVPGGSADTDLIMACLLDNYPQEWQEQYLNIYAYKCGYTHLQRSIGHALYYGSSMQSFLSLSRKAQRMGLFCDQWLISNEIPGFQNNQDAAYWAPILGPYIDQMLDAGVMDMCCPSWQMDQVNQGAPGNPTISIIAYVAGKVPKSIPISTHWVNEALAWWKTGGEVWSDQYQTINVYDRFSWWQCMNYYLTGGHHQGDGQMAINNPKLYQDKMKDTLNPFYDGRMGHSLRSGKNFTLDTFESTGQLQFDEQCSQEIGDRTGYVLTCTTSDVGPTLGMAGYGNGARMPDGAVL